MYCEGTNWTVLPNGHSQVQNLVKLSRVSYFFRRDINNAKLDKVSSDWIAEQTIIRFFSPKKTLNKINDNYRSFRKADLPQGFPGDFRQFSRYGKQDGRAGKPTHFYSKVKYHICI